MPRITYNSHDIDINFAEGGLRITPEADFSQNRSASGKIETINRYQLDSYAFDGICQADGWRQLYTFFHSWYSQGKEFSFALDKDKTFSTTLDGSAAADQKVVPLTSTTGVKAGETLILTPSAGTHREAVKVAKITAGASITTVDNLIFAYASADAAREKNYFPACKNLDKRFAWDQEGENYFFSLTFIEAV